MGQTEEQQATFCMCAHLKRPSNVPVVCSQNLTDVGEPAPRVQTLNRMRPTTSAILASALAFSCSLACVNFRVCVCLCVCNSLTQHQQAYPINTAWPKKKIKRMEGTREEEMQERRKQRRGGCGGGGGSLGS